MTKVAVVELIGVIDVAAVPPTVMLLIVDRLVPVIVTVVPPAIGPSFGDRPVIVGMPPR